MSIYESSKDNKTRVFNKEQNRVAADYLNECLAITRREYFAAMAMQGLLANSYSNGHSMPYSEATGEEIAVMAVRTADELVKKLAL